VTRRLKTVAVAALLAVWVPSSAMAAQQPGMAALKERAATAIGHRVDWLGVLASRVSNAEYLISSDRSTLQGQISSASDGLKSLGTKIQGDSDYATLRADVNTIVTGYRVYVLVTPKVHIVIAADRISAIAKKLADVEAKIQKAIDKAKAHGKDTASAQAALDDMKTKVDAAASAVSGVPASVLPLTPAGYPGNRSTLEAARTSLQTARADLVAARTDARNAIEALR